MAPNRIYILGFAIVAIEPGYGAHLAGISGEWIGTLVIVMVGLGLVNVAKRGRGKTSGAE